MSYSRSFQSRSGGLHTGGGSLHTGGSMHGGFTVPSFVKKIAMFVVFAIAAIIALYWYKYINSVDDIIEAKFDGDHDKKTGSYTIGDTEYKQIETEGTGDEAKEVESDIYKYIRGIENDLGLRKKSTISDVLTGILSVFVWGVCLYIITKGTVGAAKSGIGYFKSRRDRKKKEKADNNAIEEEKNKLYEAHHSLDDPS